MPIALAFCSFICSPKPVPGNDGNFRTDADEFSGKSFTRHLRHGHVRYDNIEVIRVFYARTCGGAGFIAWTTTARKNSDSVVKFQFGVQYLSAVRTHTVTEFCF